ncbi:MAG: PAS domain S-box protein, partial [Candidatus Hermodarchaeota archaeon]
MSNHPSKVNNNYRIIEEAIRESESRYRSLFEDSPHSLWEEDFSELKTHLDYLKKSEGVIDLEEYFNKNPKQLTKCASLVKIVNINKATLELLEAENKNDLLVGLPNIFNQEALSIFKKELIALSKGELTFQAETPHLTLKGKVKRVILRLNLVPEYRKTWSKVFISLTDITDLKQIQNQLKNSQNNLITVFNSLYDFLLILDYEGNIINANQVVIDRIGYSRGQILSMHIIELHPLERRKEAAQIMADMIAGKTDFCNIPIMTKNGTQIPVETKITKTRLGNKEVIIGISRDISERIRAEKKIRESEEKYRHLFEKSPSSIFLIDNTGKILDVNPTLELLTGYTKSELIGKKYANLNIVLPKYIPILLNRLKNIVTGEELPPIDIEIMRKDGKILWGTFISTLLKIGDENLIQIIALDITKQKVAQEELRISEQKYRYLFENAPSSILLMNETGLIIDVNPTLESLIGYKRDELIGKGYVELGIVPKKYIPRLLDRLRKVSKGLKIPPLDIQLKTKKGN